MKIKTVLAFISILLNTFILSAQTPSFQNPLNNTKGNQANQTYGVTHDTNGNIFICGIHTDTLQFGTSTLLPGFGGTYFGKLSPTGIPLWLKQGGTSSPNNDRAYDIDVDQSGNVYVCGAIANFTVATFEGNAFAIGNAGFVVKYDNSGNYIWGKGYGANIYAISVDNNNIPFINEGDNYVSKIDTVNGNVISSGTISGNIMNPRLHNIEVDGNNNIVVQAGNKIIKFDNNLNQIWSTPVTYSGAESFRLSVDATGNVYSSFYAVFGTVTVGAVSKSNFPNGYMYKLDNTTGTPLFVDSIRIASQASKIKEVLIDNDGNYYISGDGAFSVPHVVKLDSNKNTLWVKTLTKAPVNNMELVGEDCLILGGKHTGNVTLDSYTLSSPNNATTIENSYVTGLCVSGLGVEDELDYSTGSGKLPKTFALEQNYPNPFNPTTNFEIRIANFEFVSLKIFDVLGREVATLVNENLHPGTFSVSWDATGQASGVYYYKLQAGDYSATRKLLLTK